MKRFHKSVIASLISTGVDYGSLIANVELLHVDYVLATFIGTVLGFATNFTLNRFWAFDAASEPWTRQLVRSLPVQAGSTFWQTLGVWLVTRFGGLAYELSKLLVAALVYLGWNYQMNKRFVFIRAAPAGTSRTEPPAAPPPA